jgi:hypothetical protein
MSNFEKQGAAGAPPVKYWYSVCKHCGARLHIDNLYCEKCGRRYRDIGESGTLYETSEDPKLRRFNLDHPEGCRVCAAWCGWCYSFGVAVPDKKAKCHECGKTRAACCKKARKLPFPFTAEEMRGCHSHVAEGADFASPPGEKSA